MGIIYYCLSPGGTGYKQLLTHLSEKLCSLLCTALPWGQAKANSVSHHYALYRRDN